MAISFSAITDQVTVVAARLQGTQAQRMDTVTGRATYRNFCSTKIVTFLRQRELCGMT
jgi:hypothetical protein